MKRRWKGIADTCVLLESNPSMMLADFDRASLAVFNDQAGNSKCMTFDCAVNRSVPRLVPNVGSYAQEIPEAD